MESTKNCMEKNMDSILMELKETLKDFKIINEKTYKGNENVKIDYMENPLNPNLLSYCFKNVLGFEVYFRIAEKVNYIIEFDYKSTYAKAEHKKMSYAIYVDKTLIIKGCRQCGKTFSVLEFAKNNYKNVVYLNFFENPDYASVFSGSLEIDNIIMMLSALLGKGAVFEAGETVLILDEIQECQEARTALKFFQMDGRFDVIGTGSLLGVKGYGKEPRSVPVGYETVIDMYPLDFEEFLWANNIGEPIINMLRKCLEEANPVQEAIHNKMRQLLLQYTVLGGMPDVVQTFVNTKQMNDVLSIQRDIIRSYEDDMVKYAEKANKSRIKECFQSIPKQLSLQIKSQG